MLGSLLGLIVGIGRIIWRTKIDEIQVNPPISIVYMVGLLILPTSAIILGVKMSGTFDPNPNPILSGILLLVGIVTGVLYYRVRTTIQPQEKETSFVRIIKGVQIIGKWNSPERIMHAFLDLLDLFVKFITIILEGDGGFLWTLVLLAVMISVISPGGG
jgi:hypothetical protein